MEELICIEDEVRLKFIDGTEVRVQEQDRGEERTGNRSDDSHEYDSAEDTEHEDGGEEEGGEFDGPDTSSLTAFLLSLLSVSPSHHRSRKALAGRRHRRETAGEEAESQRQGEEGGSDEEEEEEEGGNGGRSRRGKGSSSPSGVKNDFAEIVGGVGDAGREGSQSGADDRQTVRRSDSGEPSDVAVIDGSVRRDGLLGRRARESEREGGGGGGGRAGGEKEHGESYSLEPDEDDVVDWQLVSPADVGDLSCSDVGVDVNDAENSLFNTGSTMSKVGGRRPPPDPQQLIRSGFGSSPPVSGAALPPLSDPSAMLRDNHRAVLCKALPALCKGRTWVLLYSTERHGISLLTLYRRSALIPGPTMLVVRDSKGAVFGAFASAPLKPSSRKKYQGGSESFVFKEIDGELKLYRQTAVNRYFYLCMTNGYAFGGGGHFALRLDSELLEGTSEVCDTYGSPCLASSEEFRIKTVELWGFAHTSRYSPRAFKIEDAGLDSIIFHGY